MADARKVVTGKVRASYVNVFRPRMNDLSGQEEYSMMLIIDKKDKKTVSAIRRAQDAAIEAKWGGKAPRNLNDPLRDADAEAEENDETVKPELAGKFFMNVKAKDAPQVVDGQREEVLDAAEFQSGDYCRVSLRSFAYDQKGNKGVSFGLNNVQVLEKGEPLGNRTRAEDDFDDWDDETGEEDWAA